MWNLINYWQNQELHCSRTMNCTDLGDSLMVPLAPPLGWYFYHSAHRHSHRSRVFVCVFVDKITLGRDITWEGNSRLLTFRDNWANLKVKSTEIWSKNTLSKTSPQVIDNLKLMLFRERLQVISDCDILKNAQRWRHDDAIMKWHYYNIKKVGIAW